MLSHFRCSAGQPEGGTQTPFEAGMAGVTAHTATGMETMHRREAACKCPWWIQLCAPQCHMQINILKIFPGSAGLPAPAWKRKASLCCEPGPSCSRSHPAFPHIEKTYKRETVRETNSCQVETCLVITDVRPSHFASRTCEAKQ